jgi:hypothetical protein
MLPQGTVSTLTEVGAFQLIKQGKIPVETHFVEALKVTINVVLYAEFDNDSVPHS